MNNDMDLSENVVRWTQNEATENQESENSWIPAYIFRLAAEKLVWKNSIGWSKQ